MNKIYRQGDLILKQIDKLPENLKLVSKENKFILAEGEQTGHKHLLVAESQTMEILQDNSGKFYLKFSGSVDLTHQEHKTITIPIGIWEVDNEREYDYALETIKSVAD